MPCFYTDLLDAGDRLANALLTGDADGAQAALDARGHMLARRPAAPPPPDLVRRYQQQEERIRWALDQQRAELDAAARQDSRAARAHLGYRHGERTSALDTAPR